MIHFYSTLHPDCFDHFLIMEVTPYGKLFGRNTQTGNTIFHEIAELGSVTLLQRIRDNVTESYSSILREKNYSGEFCGHVAAKHRGLRAIALLEILVELGADLNAITGCSGDTLLHETASSGDDELAEWLCEQQGINLNAKNYGTLTAYQVAFQRNNQKMMNILRTHGAQCEDPPMSDNASSDENCVSCIPTFR